VKGLLDEKRVRQVVKHALAVSNRDCRAILAHFLRLVRLERAQQTAKVESAMLLAADLKAVIKASLTRSYGPGLATVFSLRPSLIGGVRIQVGSDVYDGSVRARLEALEKSF